MRKIGVSILVCVVLISLLYACFSELEIYFEYILQQAKYNKGQYAVLSFFVLSSDIILPIPSSIVMFLNGVALGVIQGTLLALVSSMASATIGYYLGYWASKKFNKIPDEESLSILSTYGSFGLIITRGIPILSESICFTAGYFGMNLRYYLLLNFIGYLPICFIYAYFGNIGQSLNLFFISFGASILVSLVLWIFGRKLIEQFAKAA